ncbi:hypothetical protein BV898_10032 [Hypsibius exemplaris]|uniref:Uncharacterized protein n=1 Tax=Hypsibius exemplaris TaxID=2072580 RepID=A0A1W0WKS6_HYPEX|nr:hypothetical protein BV898_10032 [Hypsibius exemplaris]
MFVLGTEAQRAGVEFGSGNEAPSWEYLPRPKTKTGPSFIGFFQSQPAVECQVNMYGIYNTAFSSPELVDQTAQVNVAKNGSSFIIMLWTGNDTASAFAAVLQPGV